MEFKLDRLSVHIELLEDRISKQERQHAEGQQNRDTFAALVTISIGLKLMSETHLFR